LGRGCGPFSFIPIEKENLKLPESFMQIFSGKNLEAGIAAEHLMIELPSLPEELLSKDLATRQNLLDIWNSLETLSVISRSDVQQDLEMAVKAVSKGLLKPPSCCQQYFPGGKGVLEEEGSGEV